MSVQKPWEHAKSGGSEADPLAARFVESLSFDTRLYRVDIEGSIAHASMLRDVGLLDDDELDAITGGLEAIGAEIEAAGVTGWSGWQVELEDVHMCIEAALIERIGEPGRKLHTGRSRNDQVAMDLRRWLSEAYGELTGALDEAMLALESLADREGETVLPGYTHLQRAQPVCVGAEMMAWHTMLAKSRAHACWLREDPNGVASNALGSGALAGSSLPLDRQKTAETLGFRAVAPNSMEASASRDEALDMLYLLSKIAMQLSRLAEQWILYASVEFGFITLDGAHTTGSSMMPQKRNPDMLELIRGRAGGVYGDLMAMLTICKGLTIGYNRDLQEDKRHLFRAFDTVLDSLAMTTRIVNGVGFNGERIRDGLDRGFLDATSLADYLVTKEVPFRTAHQVVGVLVRTCLESGRSCLSDLTVSEVAQAVGDAGHDADGIGADVHEWLGPENVVGRYQTEGSAGLRFREHLEAARSARRE